MLRIGEFSALSSISIHMLRNYDKIGLLVPLHIDEGNGYRYYDKEQLVQANQIIALKEMGFGLLDITRLLHQEDIKPQLQEKLTEKYHELETIHDQIRMLKSILQADQASEDYVLSIVRKTIPETWTASVRGDIHAYPEEGLLWNQLGEACKDNHITLSDNLPATAIYHGIDETTGRMDVEVRLPLDKEYKHAKGMAVTKTEECEVASVIFQGGYSQISRINMVVAEWLEKNHLEINGQTFSIYHKSPGNCSDDRAFITELCFPVREK